MDREATVHGITKSQIPLSTRACVRARTHTHTHINVKSFLFVFSEFLPDLFQMPKSIMYLLAQKSHFCNNRSSMLEVT